MPFSVTEDAKVCSVAKPWAVRNSDTGQVHGCHGSEAEARQQQKALYANVPDARPKASAPVMTLEQARQAQRLQTREALLGS